MGTSRLGWETLGLKGLSLRVGGGLRTVLLPESLLWAPGKAAMSSPCLRWTFHLSIADGFTVSVFTPSVR